MIVDIIKKWMPYEAQYGRADVLRSAAMEIQDEHADLGRSDFIEAAAALGYNANTAARCWAYVAAQ